MGWASRRGDYKEHCPFECDTKKSSRNLLMFQRNPLSPALGYNTLNIEALGFSEISENFYQPTLNHSPKDIIQQDQANNDKKCLLSLLNYTVSSTK